MFKPGKAQLRLAQIALWLPICAVAGITTTDSTPPAKPPVVAEKPAKPAAAYQIRCWQYGRLLFEENHVMLPADSAKYGVKMAGTDRKGQPIYVAETNNATCLIRGAVDDPAWPASPR
ncbi:MAG TPA: hypothetical protein VJ608_07690 [Albitalea sp.]|nr:hypothetical protein [Albitalea sp.]